MSSQGSVPSPHSMFATNADEMLLRCRKVFKFDRLLRVRVSPKEWVMHNAAVNNDSESKKAVFRRLVGLYAAGNLSALDQVIAPNYVGHA
jgi:hypothetical protein